MEWLTGWTYCKEVTLTHASGAAANHQMKVLVGESSGAAGADVHCEGLCLSSFNDLRFTNEDGDVLDYFIESITGTTPNQLATVWIEFDSIGITATTFGMFFGNASAPAYSNGINTFIKFDDFEWGNDEDDITGNGGGITWSKTVAGTSTAKIDTAQKYNGTRSLRLHRDGTNNALAQFAQVPGTDYAVRFFWRKDETSLPVFYHGNGTKLLQFYASATEDIFDNSLDTTYNTTKDAWHAWDVTEINHATPTHDLWYDGVKIKDNGGMLTNVGVSGAIAFNNEAGTSDIWIDCVMVRSWLAIEPAWGAWGALKRYTQAIDQPIFNVVAGLSGTPWISLQQITPGPFNVTTGLSITSAFMTIISATPAFNVTPELSITNVEMFATDNIIIHYELILTGEGATPALGNPVVPSYITTKGAAGESAASGEKYLAFCRTRNLSYGSKQQLSDMYLPMSSFSARFNSGDPSYLEAVIPTTENLDDLNDRADGNLRLYIVYVIGTREIRNLLKVIALESIRVDQGPDSQSITLSGHGTKTHAPKVVAVAADEMYYSNTIDGLRRYRIKPNFYMNPGDTVYIDGITMVADEISWAISIDNSGKVSETMEIVEKAGGSAALDINQYLVLD